MCVQRRRGKCGLCSDVFEENSHPHRCFKVEETGTEGSFQPEKLSICFAFVSCHSSEEQKAHYKTRHFSLRCMRLQQNGYAKSPNFQMYYLLEKKSQI